MASVSTKDFVEITAWKPSNNNCAMRIGEYRGKTFYLKIHGNVKYPTQETKERNPAVYKKKLVPCKAYFDYKKALYGAITAGSKEELAAPAMFWEEEISADHGVASIRNVVCPVEAVPAIKATHTLDIEDGSKISAYGLPYAERKQIAVALLESLAMLHSVAKPKGHKGVGVVHADIKPANLAIIKVGTGYRCCLIDFDKAFFDGEYPTVEDDLRYKTAGFTPLYVAPERLVINNDEDIPAETATLTVKWDVFSLGLVIYSLLKGKADAMLPLKLDGKPAEYNITFGPAKYYAAGAVYVPDTTLEADAYALIGWMTEKDYTKRATALEALELLNAGDENKAPERYRKPNPNAPWPTDGIEFLMDRIKADGVQIIRGGKPGQYKKIKKGIFSRSAKDLINEGYAKKIGDPDPAVKAPAAKAPEVKAPIAKAPAAKAPEAKVYIPWDADRIVFYGLRKVWRGSKPGEYVTAEGNITVDKLLAQNKACTVEDLYTPWPSDGITFVAKDGESIARNVMKQKDYVVIVGSSKLNHSAGDLIRAKRATKN